MSCLLRRLGGHTFSQFSVGEALEKAGVPYFFPAHCLTLASLLLAWTAPEVGSCYCSLGSDHCLLSLTSSSMPELMGESLFPGTDSLHAQLTLPKADQLFLSP